MSAELILLLAIVVMALVVGLKQLQVAVNSELEDAADALGAISQTYSFAGVSGCDAGACASHDGSTFTDAVEPCDAQQSVDHCVTVVGEQ